MNEELDGTEMNGGRGEGQEAEGKVDADEEGHRGGFKTFGDLFRRLKRANVRG